jgi:predicted unusual protein kinase regulating ubiquinone biosynthesis (AarF/ABC1/UbiB family)
LEKALKRYYDNCNIHSLKYTKKIFKNEYKYDFDDIFTIDNEFVIKSGSIAQVYKCNYKDKDKDEPIIIKVVHPETEWQQFWIENIFIFWLYLSKKISCLNNYSLPINAREYINNFNKQFDMNNEYNNLSIYYLYFVWFGFCLSCFYLFNKKIIFYVFLF